jgi:hypothetical protein
MKERKNKQERTVRHVGNGSRGEKKMWSMPNGP